MSPKRKDAASDDHDVKTAAEIAEERARQAAAESHEPPAEPEAAEAPAAAERPAEEREPPPVITVADLVKGTVELLAAQAWQKLGLLADPQTQQVQKDIAQARLAIDCVECLCKQLDAHMSPEERRAFEGLLTDLKVNFVRQSGS